MLDPARAAVDDGADPHDPAVPDGPSARDAEGLVRTFDPVELREGDSLEIATVTAGWIVGPPPWLDDVFPPRVAPAEDRIF